MLVGTSTYLCNSLTVYDLIEARQMFNYQLHTGYKLLTEAC